MAHPSGDQATRGGSHGDLIERFQPSSARWLGVAGITAIAGGVILLVADGLTTASAATAAGLALCGLILWVSMVRPTLHAYSEYLLVRNLISDVQVPWRLIKSTEVRQTLRVYTRDGVVHAVAIGRSVKQQVRGSRPGLGIGPSFGMGRSLTALPTGRTAADLHSVSYQDFVAERIMLLAEAQRDDSQNEPTVVRRWAYLEIVALVAVAVAFVVLLVLANR